MSGHVTSGNVPRGSGINRGNSPRGSAAALDELMRFGQRTVKRAMLAGPILTFAVAAVVAGLLCYWAYHTLLSPLAERNAAAAERLAALQRDNSASLAVQSTKPQFIDAFRQILEQHDRARQLLPEEVEVSNVLAAVQQMAAKNGVRVTRFNSTSMGLKSPVADRLFERAVPTTIVGPHASVARFLADLARYPRIIHVREIAITSLKKTESADFTLVTFYSPPNLPPVPPELLAERSTVPNAVKREATKNVEVTN